MIGIEYQLEPIEKGHSLEGPFYFIRRLITADKVRHRDGQPYRQDIERITTQ